MCQFRRLRLLRSVPRPVVPKQGWRIMDSIYNPPSDISSLNLATGDSGGLDLSIKLDFDNDWQTLTGGSANTMPTSTQVPIPVSDLSLERNLGHGSLDGSDSLGDGEIEFDAFWNSSPQLNPLPAGMQK